jgi:hypothetical protein
MLKKILMSTVNYVISGGAIILKSQAIQQNIYNLDNIKPWEL